MLATESDKKPGKVKTSIFLSCIGPKGHDIHSSFDFDTSNEEISLQTVIEKFDTYCQLRKNITFLSHKFFTCKQVVHQKFDEYEYVVELCQKLQQNVFGDLTDSLTRDILICNITDLRLRECLLREPNFDLQKTIQACQSAEETRHQSKMLNATSETQDSKISVIQCKHDSKGVKAQRSCHVHLRHHNKEDGSERKPVKIQAQSQYYVNNCHYYGDSH